MSLRADAVAQRLVRIFDHPDFDHPRQRAVILGPMPDNDKYQIDRIKLKQEQDKQRRIEDSAMFVPCYEEPLLTREQEQHLFRRFNLYKYLAKHRLEQRRIAEAEAFIAEAAGVQGQLTAANLRLAVHVVKTFHCNHFEDLVAEAYSLIFKFVDYFDWRLGNKFSTYATWGLKKMLVRSTFLYNRADEFFGGMEEILNDNVIDTSLAYEEERRQRSILEMLETLLQFAKPRERQIIELRFFGEQTLDKVGKAMKLTKERVRQIEIAGLGRIRDMAMSLGMDGDVA